MSKRIRIGNLPAQKSSDASGLGARGVMIFGLPVLSSCVEPNNNSNNNILTPAESFCNRATRGKNFSNIRRKMTLIEIELSSIREKILRILSSLGKNSCVTYDDSAQILLVGLWDM